VKIAKPGAGSVRGVFAGFLGLVALHAVGSRGGSGRVGDAFADVAGVIERVMNPTVPAIPDRRAGAPAAPVAKADTKTPRLPIPAPPK
jgi:hypothetical protein